MSALYGVFVCLRCDESWPEELPPTWSDYWPMCRNEDCQGHRRGRLLTLLVELDQPVEDQATDNLGTGEGQR